ncbi:MAG: glycosyltransferase family A protein [Verrucomicrobia bacterium]|nr:glycosyltransferase family A protein [Verrucomicrobiota bacterium]
MTGISDAPSTVSIIIPARNEAHNLPKLLGSIAAQSAKPLEILVVDDGSSDDTADIARQFGAAVITPPPLPDGWRGKTWACHQGAMKARGERLLFMDADTWFEPGGLERVLAIRHDGALSIAPYHAVRKTYEDLSLFFNVCMTAGTVPKGLVGQFLLVNRHHYQLAGGHESVRGHILENFRLAGRFQTVGVPLLSMTGKGLLAFRMYPHGLGEMLRGWTKGFAAGAGGTPAGTLLLVIAWMSCLMMAPLMFFLTDHWHLWGVACLLCSLQVAWIGRKLGSFGWLLMWFYPVPLLFFFGTFGWSAARSGKKVTWKGREIDAD